MLNIFAMRSTDPKVLKPAGLAAVGELNHQAFFQMDSFLGQEVREVICAWGTHGGIWSQGSRALDWLQCDYQFPKAKNILCLGKTKEGYPKHPLYLRSDTFYEPYP